MVWNVIVSPTVLIPPRLLVVFALKNTSLTLLVNIGSTINPLPLPPVTPIEIILSISNSWVSTCILVTLPDNTGWTSALTVPPAETETTGD